MIQIKRGFFDLGLIEEISKFAGIFYDFGLLALARRQFNEVIMLTVG